MNDLPLPPDIEALRHLRPLTAKPKVSPHRTAADVLDSCAATYRERNATYGENYRMVAPIMAVLFPHGISASTLHSDRWHMFELLVVKLTRFATSNLSHQDSIHDAAVYAAMIEASLIEAEKTPSPPLAQFREGL